MKKKLSALELDLARRTKGKSRPDSLTDVAQNLSLAEGFGPKMTKADAEAELARINAGLKSAKSGLYTANAKAAGLKLPVAKTMATAMKSVEKCIAEMGNYDVGKASLSLGSPHAKGDADGVVAKLTPLLRLLESKSKDSMDDNQAAVWGRAAKAVQQAVKILGSMD
jgi:hypothetical protein